MITRADVLKRICKEFWLPALVASCWTVYSAQSAANGNSLAEIVASFGASFFLAAWATGQYVRIARQADVQSRLEKSVEAVEVVLKELRSASENIVSNITGGNGFPYISILNPIGDHFIPVVAVRGNFTLYDVSVRSTDLRVFDIEKAMRGDRSPGIVEFAAGEVSPGLVVVVNNEPLGRTYDQRAFFNVQMTARNGSWLQSIRCVKEGDIWRIADLVTTSDGVMLSAYVPPDFPQIGEQRFDECERHLERRFFSEDASTDRDEGP